MHSLGDDLLIEVFGIVIVRIDSLLADMETDSLPQGESNLRGGMKQQQFFEALFSFQLLGGLKIGSENVVHQRRIFDLGFS